MLSAAGGLLLALLAWISICVAVGGFLIAAFGIFSRILLKPIDDPLSDYAHGDVPAVPSDLKSFHHGRGDIP